MRILVRPRLPVLALLLLAPAIPELLTGSTPITPLFADPIQFAVSFLFDIGLYGTGALLIREFAVHYRKGWASILLLGAAYGIAEEGFAVHTFFETSGAPVGALGGYGHAFGVDWLWALGLTVFHATYSIALPILLTQLVFPEAQRVRWLDRGALVVLVAVYLAVVSTFAFTIGHGPSPAALAFFLAVVALLLVLARELPGDLLSPRPGPRTIGRWGLALAGTLEWDAWLAVLVLASHPPVPAIVPAAIIAAANLSAVAVVLRRVGTDDLERSKFCFAVGMLVPLFVWDGFVEFSEPGILLVTGVFAYFLYWLARRLGRGEALPPATGAPPPSPPLPGVDG